MKANGFEKKDSIKNVDQCLDEIKRILKADGFFLSNVSNDGFWYFCDEKSVGIFIRVERNKRTGKIEDFFVYQEIGCFECFSLVIEKIKSI